MKKLVLLITILFYSVLQAQNQTSIITNTNVDYTFDSEPCLLMRTIINITEQPTGQYRKYVILNQRVKFNEDNKLIILGKKDTEAVRIFSYKEIDALYTMVNKLITAEDSQTFTENKKQQMALLIMTQQDRPYNTKASNWKLYE